MKLIDELINILNGLTEEQLLKVKSYILTRLNLQSPDNQATITVYRCPECHSTHIIKFGKKNGKQRYFCKDCHKLFMPTTKTIAYKSKYGIKTWSNYVTSMLAGMSCRDAASVCGISHKTAFYWRHKIMGSLKEVLDGKLSLKGIIEADETFFPVSYKGNHKLSKDFVMPRKAHHRGKQNTKRGISSEQVCVSCMVDQNNGMQAEIAGLGRIKFSQLEHLNKVETGAILVTDKALAYRRYASKFGFDLVQLKAGKEYKRGMYSLGHINAFHSGLKRFLRPFNGVSTKHLSNYLNWHIWLLQTAYLMFDARSINMLDNAVRHQFTTTQEKIHRKAVLPIVA